MKSIKRLILTIILTFVLGVQLLMAILTVTGQTIINSDTTWNGYYVDRYEPMTFTFSNNSITSQNYSNYMLQAGDEDIQPTNNNLAGEVITGNRLTWNGTDMTSICHGVFTGCNINVVIKYNYLEKVPMGLIRKSASNMVNTSGGVAYNILNKTFIGTVVKGISNVNIYNNTYYSDRTFANTQYGRALIDVYTNTDLVPNSVAHNTKIKNNIFYTKYQINNIRVLDNESLIGFESDYNLFYCESGTPMFEISGTQITFAQWQALGYDTHSVVVNPNFIDFVNFVPTTRLNYGTNLGSTWQTGLSTSAVWIVGSTPTTSDQNGTWQVGARVYASSATAPTVTTTAVTSITSTTAISGGNVTSDGGSAVTARGVCWNTSTNPTIANSKTSNGTGTGSYSSSLTGLSNGVTYYVRAYATNSVGTAYGSNVSFVAENAVAGTYYVSTTGNDANSGTISQPFFTLNKAWTVIGPGDIVYVRGGTYQYLTSQECVGKNGTAGNLIKIWAYPGETPVITKAVGWTYTHRAGIYFVGSYFHWKGIEVSGFTQIDDNEYAGFNVDDGTNHNIFELLNIHHNGGSNRLINQDCDDNLVLNCDFHHNYDPLTTVPSAYGNADGMAANPRAGTTNTIRGCRFWSNCDDGLDLYGANGLVIVDKCWAWSNGYREDGVTKGGDGNGIKLGGTTGDYSTTHLRTVTNSLAFHNRNAGFTQNVARCISHIYNNTAYHNADGADVYNLGFEFEETSIVHILRNNVAHANQHPTNLQANYGNCITSNNTWNGLVTVTDADFTTISSTGVDGSRQSDGNLPALSFLHLITGSDLIAAGTNVGLITDGDGVAWNNPPSMGAYEYVSGSVVIPTVTTTAVTSITSTTAISGGNVTSDGGSAVTARGVCWNTSTNPTIANSKTSNGTGTGSYVSSLTGLSNGVTYYVRAYATNSVGTTYGSNVSFVAANSAPGTYYVKNGGNNNLDGLSDATAWETIDKVNSTITGGNTVLFKRGSTWRNQQIRPVAGSAGAYTTYGAYGTGAKPKILGSLTANSGWTNVSGNIWQTTGWTKDVGNIIFNNEQSCGRKFMTATPTLTTQGDFWYDYVNDRVRMYSVGNPASYYTNIEFALSQDAVVTSYNAPYIIIEDLDFRYWGNCVIQNARNYSIYRRLDISYIGGGDAGETQGAAWYDTRWGNGIQMWEGDGSYITVESCKIDQVYDAGISPQGQAGSWTMHDIFIRNNIVTNCEYNFEFWLRAGATAYNIYVEHNVFAYAGYGFAHNQRPDAIQGHNLQMGGMQATRNNIYLRNNIFYMSLNYNYSAWWYNPGPGTTPPGPSTYDDLYNITFDYNLYYTPGVYIGFFDALPTIFNTFAQWQAAFQVDESHGKGVDPLFVDPANGDFHLQPGSPAIAAGLAVAGVTTDFDGVSYASTPSMGALEYVSPTNNTYYVKNGGNDNLNGLSDSTAWETISKVNSFIKGGDKVLFKRDSVWRNEAISVVNGSAGAYTTYGAYGTGAKPRILGSVQLNSGWTNVSGNIWQNSNAAVLAKQVGNLIFNNEQSVGVKVASEALLNAQGRFYWNFSTGVLRMYSVGNPALYYSNIEAALQQQTADVYGHSYIKFENLDFRYSGEGTIFGDSNYIQVYDCNISYNGGAYTDVGGGTRIGGGIGTWDNASYWEILRCRISNEYDAGITMQGTGVTLIHDMIIRNNIIEKCEYNFEFWERPNTGQMYNIWFEHNTLAYAGYGWSHTQRPDSQQGHSIYMGGMSVQRHDIYIRNNIFYSSINDNIAFSYYNDGSYDDLINITFDYNLYYNPGVNTAFADAHDIIFLTFANWQAAVSVDESHGIGTNPLFVNAAGGDYHLSIGSPAIAAGLAVTGVTTDFDGVSYNSSPAMGAYEYVPGSSNIYYIDPTGADSAGRNGSNVAGQQWLTLAYAISRVTTGDTIHVNPGTYNISSQITVPIGISIEGDGITSILRSTYTSGPTLNLANSVLGSGNQYIANIKMDGVSTTAHTAVNVYRRSNVSIYNCTFVDFLQWGVRYRGQDAGEVEPTLWATGNSFHDNSVNNCSMYYYPGGDADVDKRNGNGQGLLEISEQQGMRVYNNTLIQTGRTTWHNGYCIKGIMGYNKDIKIYNNIMTKAAYTEAYGITWDFVLEFWESRGGIEVYGNTITGGSLDFSGSGTENDTTTQKGIYDYAVWIHDNSIMNTTLSAYSNTHGILIEQSATDVIIERNWIENVWAGIYFPLTPKSNPMYGTIFNNITVRYNVIKNVGTSGNNLQGFGIHGPYAVTNMTGNNIQYYNNTIIGRSGSNSWGIQIPVLGTLTNVYVRNNIVQGFSGAGSAGIYCYNYGTVNYAWVQYNNLYQCANSNAPLYGLSISNLTSESAYAGTVPPFVSTTDYHLTTSKDGIYITSGLTDKDGVTPSNPPDIGAYEYALVNGVYYIDPTGADSAGRNGSNVAGQQWLTLAYAISRVTTGDTIHVNPGTYTVTTQTSVPIGINIEGNGIGSSIIRSHYIAGDGNLNNACLVLSGGTNTDQHISGLTLDGDSLWGDNAIVVYNRSNVSIYNCQVVNFLTQGIRFDGSSPSLSVNNSLYGCTITNSGGIDTSDRRANIFIRNNTSLRIYNNTLNQTLRVSNTGLGIRLEDGVYGCKIYNNYLYGIQPGADWSFTMECWCADTVNGVGWGLEIYGNTITGLIDFGSGVSKGTGSYTYAVSFHDNVMGTDVAHAVTDYQHGLLFELNGSDIIIYNNEFKFLDRPIYFTSGQFSNIDIHSNIIRNVPASYSDGAGILFIGSGSPTSEQNVYIRNNTIIAHTGGVGPAQYGILFDARGTVNNFYIQNNIIQGFSSAPYESYGTTGSIGTLVVQKNVLYLNGNSNNIKLTLTPTSLTNDLGLKYDPVFVNAAAYNFHIQSTSPALRAGLYVGLVFDYDDQFWNNPPSIGAYEYMGALPSSIPSVTTSSITNILATTASGGGTVTHDGSLALSSRGICWNTSTNPTVLNSSTNNGVSEGVFTSSLVGLNPSTHYYVRAYAANSLGVGYGANVEFDTLKNTSIPIVTTTAITDISTFTATGGGNVTHDGSLAVTSKGVCWSVLPSPTIDNTFNTSGTGEGSYVSYLTGLNASTHYYVRAYAINAEGVGYGYDVSFNTLGSGISLVNGLMGYWKLNETTGSALDSVGSINGAVFGATQGVPGKISTAYRFNAATNSYIDLGISCKPTTAISFAVWLNPSTFNDIYSGVINNTTWVNPTEQYGYNVFLDSSKMLFELFNGDVQNSLWSNATITPNTWHFIVGTWDGAKMKLYINNVLDASQARTTTIGYDLASVLRFGSHSAPYDYTGVIDEIGIWNRALTISEVSTLYNSSNGLTYPFDASTNISIPTVTTSSVTNIFTTSASCGGNVTHDGSTAVTAKGVCWNTSINPTVLNSSTNNGTGTGVFTSAITGLNPSTHYYVRAYATNAVGTAYGSNVQFDTSTSPIVTSIPTVTTSSVTNIFTTSASCGGNVTHDGSTAVIAKGVCWSILSNPTISSALTNDGTGEGSFTSAITGLNPSTHYYVRAYATNAVGTGYGNQITFDSSIPVSVISTYYINAINGNDASAGTTQNTAWKTVAKVNAYTFIPGDTVLFRRGDTWNERLVVAQSGISGYPITYSNYGVGANPIFNAQNIRPNGIRIEGVSYIIIDGIDTINSTEEGIVVFDWNEIGSSNVTIKNLTSFNNVKAGIYMSIPYGTIMDCSTINNGLTTQHHGIYMGRSSILNNIYADNWLIERCHSYGNTGAGYQIYNSGSGTLRYSVTNNNGGTSGGWGAVIDTLAPNKNVNVYYNVLYNNDYWGLEVANLNSGDAVNIYNNVMYNNGQADYGAGLHVANNDNVTDGSIKIKNNLIFSNVYYDFQQSQSISKYTVSNNDYWKSFGNIIVWNSITYPQTQFASYQVASGDILSISKDPSVVNAAAYNFNLTSSSSCKNAGVNVGLTTDFIGTGIINFPDIGAYEFIELNISTPTVTTSLITNIAITSASCGGNVSHDGSTAVTAKGICWNTFSNPTIYDSSTTNDGIGEGIFYSALTNLNPSTHYYVRAYATNEMGTAYGNEVTLDTSKNSYYVNIVNGNDLNSGTTENTAWKTITRVNTALTTLPAGYAIRFRKGDTWYGTINIGKSGAANFPITIGSYGTGANPVITGFTTASSWTNAGNGIYYTSLTAESSTLMVSLDGYQAQMGKWPAIGWNHIESTNGTSTITDTAITSTYNWIGAQVVIRKNRWVIDKCIITNQSGNTITYNDPDAGSYQAVAGWGYFIQADLSTLVSYGNWYHDHSANRFYMYFGAELPANHVVKISSLDRCIYNSNYDHITIDGLTLEGANIDGYYGYNSASNHIIQNCNIGFSGRHGIYLQYPSNCIVQNCSIYSSNDHAVYSTSQVGVSGPFTISRNTITNTFIFPGTTDSGDNHGNALYSCADNTLIQNNRILNTGHLPINWGGTNSIIRNNIIDTFCFTTDNGAGIYTYGDRNTGKQVIGNIVLNAISATDGTDINDPLYPNTHFSHGLYTDGFSAHVSFIGNTVGNVNAFGIRMSASTNIVLKDNTFYQSYGFVSVLRSDTLIRDISVYNNVFISNNLDEHSPEGIKYESYFTPISSSTATSEIQGWGYWNNNYYYTNTETAMVVYGTDTGQCAPKSLEKWKTKYNHDTTSVFYPKFSSYTINSSGTNMLSNSRFDSDINNWTGTSLASISWVSNSSLDGGALKLRTNKKDYNWNWWDSDDYFYSSIGAVESNKTYIIKLLGKSELANKTISVRMYQTSTGNSIQQFFTLPSTSVNKEILFKYPQTDPAASLRFAGGDGDASVYFDNIYCYEASVNLIDVAATNFHFIYNTSENINKTYSLSAPMNDIKGNYYAAGMLDLSTWNSLVLFGTGTVTEGSTAITYVPTVTTSPVTNIFLTSASTGGNVTNGGGLTVTSRGVCWNTSINPTILNSSTNNGTGTGVFTSALSNLNPSTHYYVRAYAENSQGIGYGSNVQFDTSPNISLATVTTGTISNIFTTSASSGGTVVHDGSTLVTARGVCWNNLINPTILNSKSIDGTGEGVFTSALINLNASTHYYVRAYATNAVGTAYGSNVQFDTSTLDVSISISLPVVSTIAVTNILLTSASCRCDITSDGSASVTARGACWNTSINPTVSNSHTVDGSGTGIYTSSLLALNPSTHYYVRAYATNVAGTAYGLNVQFDTNAISVPTIFTNIITDISLFTATGGGNVTHDGSSAVITKGICWSISSNPTILNPSTNDGSGTGSYISYLTGLNSSTYYYVRGYATNSAGVGYGQVVTFSTLSAPGNSLFSGLMGYWALDEISGPVLDSYGSINGTNYGATPNVPGKLNTGYYFDALEHDYISFGNVCKPTAGLSFSMWIKAPAQNDIFAGVINNNYWYSAGNQAGYNIFIDSSKLLFELSNGASTSLYSNKLVDDNEWHFVAGTWDGSIMKIYIDSSVADASLSRTTPLAYDVTSTLRFGSHSAPYDYTGILDEVGIWNRALTPTEIGTLYNDGNGLGYPFATQEVSTSLRFLTNDGKYLTSNDKMIFANT